MIDPQAARKLNLPFPELFGSGVTIVISGPIRSGQSLMCFGLVFRTTKIIVEVYGCELWGNRSFQSLAISPRLDRPSMSEGIASATTSAGSPSATAWA